MKKIFLILIISVMTINTYAQTIHLNDPLPTNKKLVKGVLKNGMTYYIYPTDVVKDAASYYIITNAGSILENDNQSGLAHFLEHMAFNGTKNFPGKGVLNTLQKYGAVFAKDINAHTAFDETVYNMNNIPTKDGMVDTSLLILHDWANEISLIDDEIDAERGVILEEKRTRENAQMRLIMNALPEMFVHTKYAERLPIGKEEVIKNFKHKALRDFYHDWYRTDLQAIAVVGDIDVKEVEAKIKKLFSKIPAVKNPKERFVVTIPENKEMLFNLSTDKEVSTSFIKFGIHFNKNLKAQTGLDLKNSLLDDITSSLLSDRFNEFSQKPNADFLMAYNTIGSLTRTENNFITIIEPKPDKQYEAFKTVLEILNRAVKFGFTQPEIDRNIASVKNRLETMIIQVNDLPHVVIEKAIEQNYLENKTFADDKAKYDFSVKVLDGLTAKDIQNHLKKLYTDKNRVLLVTGVEGKKNLNEKDALKIINSVENDKTLQPYKDAFSGKSLMDGIEIKPGNVISEIENKEIDATTFELSNGVKVHYKFYDKETNVVQLYGFSNGGMSLLKDKDLPSAEQVSSLVQLSGLADYSATDLQKVLAGKTASSNFYLGGLTEDVMGNSTTKDVETMLQLTYLRFVKPRFDKESFQVLVHNLENNREISKKNIQSQMMDSVLVNVYGKNNPKKRLQDEAYIKEVSFEKIKEIYLDRFKDASGFEFFITGDIKKEDLKPLLEKYIASIPTHHIKENWKDNSPAWLKDNIDKDIFLKMETPKATVNILYQKEMKWSMKNDYLIMLLKDILQLRYTTTLREEEGGTYGAQVFGVFDKRPNEKVRMFIMFDGNPDKIEKLLTIVHGEIGKIKKGEIDQVDFDKSIVNYRKQLKERKDKNDFAQKLLYNYFVEGINIDDPKNNLEILNSLTKKDLQDFTNAFINDAKSYEIVFKPKN